MEKQMITGLETPALILDQEKMHLNIERMRTQINSLNVSFRQHVKTSKCIPVAERIMPGTGSIAVSTLREADYFAAHGFKDILYAVGIAPNKLQHVADFSQRGVKLSIILDNIETARLIVESIQQNKWNNFNILIEIDSDGQRAGIRPHAPELIEIGLLLHKAGVNVEGVLTHAGGSYHCQSLAEIEAIAEQERLAAVIAAERLRSAGIPCPVVSVGSTPTALSAKHLDGVTEVRAGVFVFFDLVMSGLGVCRVDDIALSVLATVIGHQEEKGWTIIDAGWMAMSRDRGTAKQRVDQGYGVVCTIDGHPIDDLIVIDANQEHGIIVHRSGKKSGAPKLPVGTLLRILPNHACSTAAQFDRYQVIAKSPEIVDVWTRFNGW